MFIKKKYRYPGGGYSFCEADQPVFFGRQPAIDYVYNSVLLNQCVVIFGKSGIGKSSLLQAGIIPRILQSVNEKSNNNNFRIYFARTGVWQPAATLTLIQRLRKLKLYRGGATQSNQAFLPFLSKKVKSTLWYKFKSMQFNAASDQNQDIYLIIIDQVEEIFTFPGSELSQLITELSDLRSPILPATVRQEVEELELKHDFTISTEEYTALYKPIPIKLILSIRADKLYLLGRLRKAVPTILQNTFELFPFSEEQAKEAVLKPSQREGSFYSSTFDLTAVFPEIMQFLLQQPVEEIVYNTEKYNIDPFSLQVICRHIEKAAIASGSPDITKEMIGDINMILQNYYANTLAELSIDPPTEIKIRQLIEEKMIYEPHRQRIPVYGEIIINDHGIDRATLNKLVGSRLIRETTPGSRAFEISHDSLIIPILSAKRERQHSEYELQKKYDATSRDVTRDVTAQELEKEISKNPYDYKLFKNRAASSYNAQQFTSALGYYEKALKYAGEHFDEDLYIGMSNTLFKLGKYSESNYYLMQIIAKNPGNSYAFYCIGYNFYLMKNYEQALNFYNAGLKINPTHKELLFNTAVVHRAMGQLNNALDYFQKVIQLYPHEFSTHRSLLEIYIQQNNDIAANECAYNMFLINPTADTYRKIGNIYVKRGNNKKALEYFLKSLELDPSNSSLHSLIGISYSYIGQLEESIAHFRLACLYYEKNSYYHTWLGFLYQRMKNYQDSLSEFEKAVEYDPKYRYATAALAAAYRRAGNKAGFQTYLKKAQEMTEGDAEDEYSKASIEALCGNNKKALYYLKLSIDKGLRTALFVEQDPDFDFIRDDPDYLALIKQAKEIETASLNIKQNNVSV